MGPPNTCSLGRLHPRGPISQSLLHDVLGLGPTDSGSEYHEARDLDFNAEDFEAMLDRELDETPQCVGMSSHSTASHGFSSSASTFQSNRPDVLSWNAPASSSRHSSAASTSSTPNIAGPSSLSTSPSSGPSNSRRAGAVSKKQDPREDSQSSSNRSSIPASPLSQAELGDYLIGWSRYCPSLRVVQIDHRWWWERRFAGDPWILHVVRNSEKGKGPSYE